MSGFCCFFSHVSLKWYCEEDSGGWQCQELSLKVTLHTNHKGNLGGSSTEK